MYENCPVCGLKFEREQGYFVGALYVSYGLSILPVLALVLIFWRVAHWSYGTSLAGATIAYFGPLEITSASGESPKP